MLVKTSYSTLILLRGRNFPSSVRSTSTDSSNTDGKPTAEKVSNVKKDLSSESKKSELPDSNNILLSSTADDDQKYVSSKSQTKGVHLSQAHDQEHLDDVIAAKFRAKEKVRKENASAEKLNLVSGKEKKNLGRAKPFYSAFFQRFIPSVSPPTLPKVPGIQYLGPKEEEERRFLGIDLDDLAEGLQTSFSSSKHDEGNSDDTSSDASLKSAYIPHHISKEASRPVSTMGSEKLQIPRKQRKNIAFSSQKTGEYVEKSKQVSGKNLPEMTHVDSNGRARMVDITQKIATEREAVASGEVQVSEEVMKQLKENNLKKGDALTVAQVAGLLAAKKTEQLIPLCHSIPLNDVQVLITLDPSRNVVKILAEIRCTAKTGAEMEALTAVSVAALTIYDMCKAVSTNMVIGNIQLVRKTGGKTDLDRSWKQETENQLISIAKWLKFPTKQA